MVLQWYFSPWQWRLPWIATMILQPKPSLINPRALLWAHKNPGVGLHTLSPNYVGKTVMVDSLENNTCFTLSTAQDLHCWHQWNQHLKLDIDKWLKIWLLAWPWTLTPVLVVTGELQTGLVPGLPFQKAASVTPVGCGSSNVVVCQHYPGYHSSWIHHKDLLSWSQLSKRDAHQQIVLCWTLICLSICCVDCNLVCTAMLLFY